MFPNFTEVTCTIHINSAHILIKFNLVYILQVVYVTIGNPAFCLFLYLTDIHFQGELQQVGDFSEQKKKC